MMNLPLIIRLISFIGILIATSCALAQLNRSINQNSDPNDTTANLLTDLRHCFRLCFIFSLYTFAVARIWPDQIFPEYVPLFAFLAIIIPTAIIFRRPKLHERTNVEPYRHSSSN